MVDFDNLCDDYAEGLNKALRVFGEEHGYCVELKVLWIREFLKNKRMDSNLKILEVGCGVGSLTKYVHLHLPGSAYYGIDISLRSIEKANQTRKDLSSSYYCKYDGTNIPFRDNSFDLVILAGLLHHIQPEDRLQILSKVYQVLNTNGYLFIFDHNIYNPIVRYIVKRLAMDQNAKLLSLNKSLGYLSKCNFRAVQSDYIIFFPSLLKKLRFLEKQLSWLPLGAQYAIAAKK